MQGQEKVQEHGKNGNLDREKKSDQNGTLSRTWKLQEWTMLINLSKDKESVKGRNMIITRTETRTCSWAVLGTGHVQNRDRNLNSGQGHGK
jgi:hypothetical protein